MPEKESQTIVKKDEKDRVRECLGAALRFYRAQLNESAKAKEYLASRGVPAEFSAWILQPTNRSWLSLISSRREGLGSIR